MSAEILIAFIAGATAALITSNRAVSRGVRRQQDILGKGEAAEGRVLKVYQPPLYNAFVRIYFEFQPSGSEQLVRVCHVDQRPGDERTSRPAVGSRVGVRYLPQAPAHAVIARLVPRSRD